MNWRRKHMTWELSQAGWGGHEVVLHLTQGWEPFSVTSHDYGRGPQYIIWFRRQVEK